MQEKYYYARRPEINRVVDVSGVVDQIIDANRANRAKGPAGNLGSRLRAELAKRGQKLPLLGDDDVTADRNYIREFILARRRALGQKHGVQYAEAFHYIGGAAQVGRGGVRQEERGADQVTQGGGDKRGRTLNKTLCLISLCPHCTFLSFATLSDKCPADEAGMFRLRCVKETQPLVPSVAPAVGVNLSASCDRS